MILINAASYINAEFVAELGRVPPCMLPIGNKKLLQLQVDVLRRQFPQEKIIVSLPESYVLSINEQAVIESLAVEVQWIPEHLRLADVILYVLNLDIDQSFRYVRIIQGDVLINHIPSDPDCIGVSEQIRHYDWHERKKHRENPTDWIGYFAFSSRLDLIKALAVSKGSLVKAIERYQQTVPMVLQTVFSWHDCSHFSNYIHARATITTERAFNSLLIENGIVTKTSDDPAKIQAEIYWFTHIPPSLRRFTPQLVDFDSSDQHTFYSLEFLPFMPLNELYVHGRNSTEFWHYLFGLLQQFFYVANHSTLPLANDGDFAHRSAVDLYQVKTLQRLTTYERQGHVSLTAAVHYEQVHLGSIREIADHCIEQVLKLPNMPTVMHGDLCFSNIMYDARGRRIKVFDPRGTDSCGQHSIFGPDSYDLAKLTHSVLGMYDFIIAGRYELRQVDQEYTIHFDIDDRLARIQQDFLAMPMTQGLETKQIIPAVVLLFLSMLPLHADRPDRQQAMLINAFRLYKTYVMETALCS